MSTLANAWLPSETAPPADDEEPLEVAWRVLGAFAVGIAIMQLLAALAAGETLPAFLWAIALGATVAGTAAWRGSSPRGPLGVIGGSATVLVWLGLAIQASPQPMLVALGMAGLSAVMTRHLIAVDTGQTSATTDVPNGSGSGRSRAWIEDDREGFLQA